MKQGWRAQKVHFASLMDICQSEECRIGSKIHRNIQRSEVVLRGDIVKDDSGSYAVLTEQGSSASQMTAAKFMDIISRLPGFARTSSWSSICLYLGSKWKMLQFFWKFQNRNVQTFGFVYHDTNGLNHGPIWKIQSFLLSGHLYGHPLARLLWERQFEKISTEVRLGECFQLGMLTHTPWKRIILICLCGDDIKHWLERSKTLIRCGKYSIKKLSWENQHLSLIMYTLGCYSKKMSNKQRYCGQLQNHVWITDFPQEQTEKLPCSENLRVSSWSYDMEGHAKKCVERYCELVKQDGSTTLQSINSMPWRPSFQRRRIEIRGRIVKSMLSNCSGMLIPLPRIGRSRYSMASEQTCKIHHKMDQSLWQTPDLDWFHIFITHVNTNNILMWETTAKQYRLGLFQDSDFAGDLEDSKSTSGGTLCVFGIHTFVPINWMCKKQTSVSHSSTESEIIFFGCSIEVGWYSRTWFLGYDRCSSWKHESEPYRTGRPLKDQRWSLFNTSHDSQTKTISEEWSMIWTMFILFPQTSNSSRQEALLFVFENNEAVTKMIIKGRSLTMTHVSRTHRVARDWLFARINVDPKIEIKCIDTKNQLANILTKGNFTRDEWNHHVCLFNISHFSSTDCHTWWMESSFVIVKH